MVRENERLKPSINWNKKRQREVGKPKSHIGKV
jgi:hypothetical protein